MTRLRVIADNRQPVICWPWHLWFLTHCPGHPRGGNCRFCDSPVAVPKCATKADDPVCVYCAEDKWPTGEDHPMDDPAAPMSVDLPRPASLLEGPRG